ncbi:transposase [Streptomyces sp. SAI-163]
MGWWAAKFCRCRMALCLMTCGIVSSRCSRLVRRGVGGIRAGCQRMTVRLCAGSFYVLRTGVTWADVPTETIGCSGVTCWRRLRDWTEAGVWPRLHAILLAELRGAGLLAMDDAAIDGSHVRALKGGLTPDLRRSTAAAPAASTT